MEIQDTSKFRPISDQQMVSVAVSGGDSSGSGRGESQHSNGNPNVNDITYVGPYIEGQNVTIICSAYGGQSVCGLKLAQIYMSL